MDTCCAKMADAQIKVFNPTNRPSYRGIVFDDATVQAHETYVELRLEREARDGHGGDYMTTTIQFCPWCGAKIPVPLKSQSFEERLWTMGCDGRGFSQLTLSKPYVKGSIKLVFEGQELCLPMWENQEDRKVTIEDKSKSPRWYVVSYLIEGQKP